jgi:hypothetical protein
VLPLLLPPQPAITTPIINIPAMTMPPTRPGLESALPAGVGWARCGLIIELLRCVVAGRFLAGSAQCTRVFGQPMTLARKLTRTFVQRR